MSTGPRLLATVFACLIWLGLSARFVSQGIPPEWAAVGIAASVAVIWAAPRLEVAT
jgi:hypothetical protein